MNRIRTEPRDNSDGYGRWQAIDQDGRAFIADSEGEARRMCHDYNHPPQRRRRAANDELAEQGRKPS